MSNKKPEVTFKYIFNYAYNPTYVNGAHGGLTPRGELVMNFYLERPPLPQEITHELDANGMIGNVVSEEPSGLKNSMVRYIDNGVVLNFESARTLHFWLGERLKEMESLERAKAAINFPETGGQVTH